jgi:type I restriction enzyme S subunit
LSLYESAALSLCRVGESRALAEVAAVQGGIQKHYKRVPKKNSYPFLRVANVTKHGLDLKDVHNIELFAGELDRIRLRAGDLLVVEGNGSPSQIGRAAVWDGSIDNCVHQNHLIRVRPGPLLIPAYLEAVWNSPENRKTLTQLANSSSGLHTISASKLKKLHIPVPSVELQAELLKRLQAARDQRQRLKSALCATDSNVSLLRQALFEYAFSGRLH